MECNKDEAMKAKQIAEIKMQCGDFVGALKFATKAKSMYADVENISKILTVCEVHSAAQNKLSGSGMDWYGILQAERFSDGAALKKQYRRLALLLHPDKNKFSGAEAAFKLIGEANRVLGDETNRSLYDMTCGVSVRTAAPKTSPHHSNGNVFAAAHDGNATNYQKKSSNPPFASSNAFQQAGQQAIQTFWTSCKHCNTKYQFYRIYVNASLRCPRCMKSFTALDLGNQGFPPGHTQKSFNNENKAPKHVPPKPPSKSKGVKPVGGGHADKFFQPPPVSMEKCAAGVGGHCKDEKSEAGHAARDVANGNVRKPKAMGSQTSANVGSKRVRQSAPHSGEGFNSSNGDGMKDADVQQNGFDPSRLNARRSSRQKKNVSYAEDDFESTSKKPRQNESFNNNQAEEMKEPASGGLSNSKNPASFATSVGDQNREMGNQASSAPEDTPLIKTDIQCLDADFSDFEKDKAESCFTVNQFWAIYDDTDTMPRFYALVKKVASPFKLQITWLEPDPDDEGGISWFNADLPFGCGKFKLGGTQKTADRAMFSHQMHGIKGSGKGSYMVCPKQGETWAIFRDWDIKWSSDPEKRLKYEFDYVEILSDFAVNIGIEVAYLGKVKGFVSLFQKTEKKGTNGFCVHPNELYRFSHRVPSYKMTGNEREGVPKGSFELDPAALPSNLFEVGDSGDVRMEN
ncbi:hypothetical protein TanjilG_31726 [Lupinus angustifolius]|uniref:J domain-containing protein n=1 Tax=Lupinus angustifolius TaxID=3871 RepID=A0A4P1RMJ0_LUPAN|nr:PREDICTED: J domain-containing protein DDB_G0295729-like [Lupinus angustifolius]OIW13837.1 hypothetical protein TanjilG_31726 [Lupinus angustifolius]